VYYVISPRSLGDVIADPWRALGYTGILVSFSIIFSLTWLEVGGLGPSTVAKQLVDSGMQIPGFRRSEKPIEQVLKRYIPTVTILGGAIVGLIASVADFFGVFGTGMGVLLSVGILYQYYQILVQERVSEMYPALRRFFGG
jgi:preprotein translocase subunit SecY